MSAAEAHGGRLIAAWRRFPKAPAPFVDLSTGINPVAYPQPPLPPEAFTRLPEPEDEAALEAVAAHAYGVADPALVVAVPGTQLAIQTLARLHPGRRVAILGPTYTGHAAAWREAGAAVYETTELDALAGAEVAVLCNPNNPDGRTIPVVTLHNLADTVARRDGLLMVDEAFTDFDPDDPSLARLLPHASLVVPRSFGKAYGLAGLWQGFVLARAARAAALRVAVGPWAVSGPALAIGRVALADAAWRDAAAARLQTDVVALDASMERLGLAAYGRTSLFRLGEGAHAGRLFTGLGEAGILVRRFVQYPRLLRFGLPGTPDAWTRLRAVAASRDRRQSA